MKRIERGTNHAGLRPAFKVTSAWTGYYDQNGFDNNAIHAPWIGELENFRIVAGFSGHALMWAPAVGHGLSELPLRSPRNLGGCHG